MKKTFLFVVMLLLSYLNYAQFTIEDAIKIKKDYLIQSGGKYYFNPTKKNEILTLFAKYVDVNDDTYDILTKNPFLLEFEQSAFALQATVTPSLTDNIGGSKDLVSMGIDAMGRFIVDRIKKELQATFFERLNTFIKKDKYRDCRTLFPNTYQTLQSIGDQIYNYEIYLTSLRNSFGRDLEVILPNLESVIRNGQYASFFSAHQELRSICLTALFVTKGLKNGDHIGTILEKFPATDVDYIPTGTTNDENRYIVRTIQFIQELSKSLKSSSGITTRYWCDNTTLQQLSDETTLKLYFGLLYERVKNISFGTAADENFGELLKKGKDKFDQLQQLISTSTDNIIECEAKLTILRGDKKTENYINYFNSISNFLNGIRNSNPFRELDKLSTSPLSNTAQSKIDKAWELLDKANFIIDNGMNIYTHLSAKQYTLVVTDVRNIYHERFAIDKINTGNNSTQKKAIESVFDFLIEYGSALSEMTEAKNSKEVYEAIDRIAAPVGSSRVKKETVFSISLNAYGGLFIGKEKIEGVKDNDLVNNYGISAPVGLAFSFGKIKFNKNSDRGNKSISLFFSIIDLGAPVSFRFQNDTLNEVPSITWKDIISPGAHIVFGFGKMPISLSAGVQTGPNLRKVTSTFNEYSNSKYTRFSLGLFVDIPVFIFTKRKYW